MSSPLEFAAIAAIVGSAATYLLYRGWRTFRGKSKGCGTCSSGSCAANEPAKLLEIQPLKK